MAEISLLLDSKLQWSCMLSVELCDMVKFQLTLEFGKLIDSFLPLKPFD